jgi:hypothetical protein
MEQRDERLVRQVKILLARLERLSADSSWAHQASGLRGSLIRCLDQYDEEEFDREYLEKLLARGFEILIQAAREIPDQNSE